ncbi:MAG: efflux RND transporter permease subunit [Lachnospiraceae bacterium]|jgi:multidrug efflux pump subunit AcrB|nr:efflux RND transporter permease subunit [Lachnospiraceae bacterium]
MSSLTRLALKRPVSSLLIVLALLVFGIGSVFGFKMELTPDMEMPMLFVQTIYQGGDPATTEELVTKIIEDAGKTLSGVESVTSQTTEYISFVMFSYEYGIDIDEAYADLRSALDTASLQLPDDAQDPVIYEMDMNAQDMMTLSVTSTGDTDVLAFVEDELRPELERLSDVAQITVSGGEQDYIRIQLHRDKMQQYGVTMANVRSYIAATDFTVPIGSVDQGAQSISTSASSKPANLMDLQNVPIITARGTTIALSDIATVSMSARANSSISRYNGQDSISIGIAKVQSEGTVDVSNHVKSLVERVAAKNSAIQISVAYDAADSIKSSLSSVAETLVLGVLFSMLVLFIFFGDFKASLIVGSSMPISLLATLIFMSFAGFSLNVVTMGALVIAIGMMVDASIVVLESCFRLKDEKPDYKDAAMVGTKVVASSVSASTITTVVVYLPLATMKGLAGQLFSQLGYTIIFAMLSSLIVAITLIPIFFWKYRPKEKKDTLANQIVGKIGDGYKTLLKHIMLKKKTVMLVAVGLLALAFVLAGQLDQELMSATGIDNMSISIEQRAGTRLEVMDENIRFIEQMIIDDTDFAGCNLTISGSSATITAYPSESCEKSINQLVDIYNEKLLDSVDMSVIVSAGGSGMTSMMSVMSSTEVDLVGDNIEDLKTAARQVDTILMDIPGIIKTSSNLTSDAAQAKIQIDPLKCMNVGLTAVQVAGEMYNASSGIEVMDMTIGTEEYSVRMEYPDGSYVDMNQLLNLEIATPAGSTITVGDVAEAVYSDVPNTLMREDGKYQVAITAYTTDAMKYTAKETIVAAVEAAELRGEFPEGVSQTQNMMDEMLTEEFTAIGKAIFTAVFLIFLVMAMQFESPVFSLMVMLSIPFSLIGSFFLLFITGSTLNMTSLMGVLMLVGIVVNNGILYVDTTNQLKEEMPLNDALMESGRLRLRPILMTTLTTILSMIPMIFAQNENAAMMKGMSLIIIGGLVTSTLLILLLLPSFYLLMSKQGRREAKERRQMKRQKKLAEKDL